ncbi:hypothetical protein M8J75_008840 [Diaphorina citri]|nr:hypothetical protein M8J75_008840 [Diaphorina citri]
MYCVRQSFRNILRTSLDYQERLLSLGYHSVAHLYQEREVGSRITLKGWVKAVRKMKGNNFIDVSDGSSFQSMQVVVPKNLVPENLTYGCSVEIDGTLGQFGNGQLEVKAENVNVLGPCVVSDGYPFQPRKSHDSDYVREYLHLRSRTKSFASLLRLRSFMTQYTHQYFHQQGFVNIHTPILTSNDCEGAGEVFTVIPDSELTPSQEQINKDKNPMRGTSSPILDPKETFFGEKAYLTVSGQLHLEAMARSLSKVYTLNPTFRAENSKSRLHLAEFYMIEAELAFLDNIHDLCNTIEQFIKSVLNRVLESHEEELLTYRKLSNLANTTDLQCIHDNPFIRMSYSAAVTILTRHGFDVNPDGGLSKQHELFLVKYTNNVPIFIINWPKHVKPFYMKRSGEDPDQVLAVDLLCPLVGEVCGGGLREDDYSILQSTLYEQGLQEKLDWYLELRKFGNVPTGGFGVGLERFVQVVLGQENIKDVIPYPRYPHHCKL